MATDDANEGLIAFTEKRTPVWSENKNHHRDTESTEVFSLCPLCLCVSVVQNGFQCTPAINRLMIGIMKARISVHDRRGHERDHEHLGVAAVPTSPATHRLRSLPIAVAKTRPPS